MENKNLNEIDFTLISQELLDEIALIRKNQEKYNGKYSWKTVKNEENILNNVLNNIVLFNNGHNYIDNKLIISYCICELETILFKNEKFYNKIDVQTDSAIKYDDNKSPLSYISYSLLKELTKVRRFGALKYSKNNWKKGFMYTRSISACMRHLLNYINGQLVDNESGLSHVSHAICCLEHLLYDFLHHPELDDRYKIVI